MITFGVRLTPPVWFGRAVSKAPPPLLGFNNNVRHRGRIFHIQTEDSGIKFPRIVTHLFADGGRIVKTTRTDYSEHLSSPNMAAVVRGMMKEQHKGMFAALRAGDLDKLLEQVCGSLEPSHDKQQRGVLEAAPASELDGAGGASRPRPEPPESSEMPVAPLVRADGAPVDQAQLDTENASAVFETDAAARKRAITNPNLRKPTPSAAPPQEAAFDLDVESLDKNPPRVGRPTPPSARPARTPAPRKSRPPLPARPAPAAAAPVAVSGGELPSSVSRPQSRLAASPPAPSRSIFGDGAISEQSLDEVILSYLAEDLEETK